jgi:hypothetical protein
MMRSKGAAGVIFLCLSYLLFLFGAKNFSVPRTEDMPGSVVLPPALQSVLYLGDPYLAANVEATRVLMTGGPVEGIAQDYYDRLHQAVAILNPCHEDNYYVANALLAWAGSVEGAIAILRGATACRFWDEVPPFFLSYNLYFFKQRLLEAKQAVFEAASRATNNRAGFLRMGIFYEAETYPDIRSARNFLVGQRDQARDAKLKMLLDRRIGRLDGLITLQDAQAAFEKRHARRLRLPNELISSGILKSFPEDPVRLGYIFKDGRFELKELKMRGPQEKRK